MTSYAQEIFNAQQIYCYTEQSTSETTNRKYDINTNLQVVSSNRFIISQVIFKNAAKS